MFCRFVSSNLLAYHYEELSAFAMRLIRRHLAGCQQCQKAYEQLASFDTELHNLAVVSDVPADAGTFSALVGMLEDVTESEAIFRQTRVKQTSSRPALPKLRMAAVTACALICLLLLPGVMPQVMVSFADVPVIGEWIQRAVVQDAGLKWAYDNGYVLQDPIKLRQGEYEMTILGYVADPVQTAVITLVNGPNLRKNNGESLYHVLLGVPGSACWGHAPLITPLGELHVVYASPLPSGGSEVAVEMRMNRETLFSHQLFITPEPIAKASTEQPLMIAYENERYSYSIDRLIATPSQYMLELTYRNLKVMQAPQLEMSTGQVLDDTYSFGFGNEDGSWRKPLVFPRAEGEPRALHIQATYWQPVQDHVIQSGSQEAIRIGNDQHWVEVKVPSWTLDAEAAYSGLVENNNHSGKSSRPETNFSLVITSHGYEAYRRGLLVDWELLTADGRVLTLRDLTNHAFSQRGGDSNKYVEHVNVPEGTRIAGLRIKQVAIPCEPITIPLK